MDEIEFSHIAGDDPTFIISKLYLIRLLILNFGLKSQRFSLNMRNFFTATFFFLVVGEKNFLSHFYPLLTLKSD